MQHYCSLWVSMHLGSIFRHVSHKMLCWGGFSKTMLDKMSLLLNCLIPHDPQNKVKNVIIYDILWYSFICVSNLISLWCRFSKHRLHSPTASFYLKKNVDENLEITNCDILIVLYKYYIHIPIFIALYKYVYITLQLIAHDILIKCLCPIF